MTDGAIETVVGRTSQEQIRLVRFLYADHGGIIRGKAASALTTYHGRFQSEEAEPLWFERAFSFKLGPHLLRGRVDRVDRLRVAVSASLGP